MKMQIVTSGKVQSNFGAIAEIAKFGEPVTITQYGRPTLLLIRYQDGMDALRELAAKNMTSWQDGRAQTAPDAARHISEEALNAIINKEIEQKQIVLAMKSLEHYDATGLHVTLDEMKAWLKARKIDRNTPVPACHI